MKEQVEEIAGVEVSQVSVLVKDTVQPDARASVSNKAVIPLEFDPMGEAV